MKQLWKWVVAAVAGLAGLIGLSRLLGNRRASDDPASAQARLDDAVELGHRDIEDANEAADKEVENGMAEHGTLGDYLRKHTRND